MKTKCDDCCFQVGYVLNTDEVGGGNWFDRCVKGHWDGIVPEGEEPEILTEDVWKDCKDYKSKSEPCNSSPQERRG